MKRLTRRTTKEDYERKAKSYWMGEDESTSEQFIEKFPYTITKGFRFHSFNEYLNKLGRLEDLEEELGCPLEVVFKALEEGIEYEIEITTYYAVGETIPTKRLEKRKNIKEIKLNKYINKFAFFVPYDYSRGGILKDDIIYLKDYQKTWWLKGEVNEKDI